MFVTGSSRLFSGVRVAVHLRQKADRTFCHEIPPRTPRSYRSQCTQGKADASLVRLVNLFHSRNNVRFPYNPNVQGLKEQIDSRLSMVQEIRFEPRLLAEEDDRLKHGSQISQLL